jgi:hypothetical protein
MKSCKHCDGPIGDTYHSCSGAAWYKDAPKETRDFVDRDGHKLRVIWKTKDGRVFEITVEEAR